MCTPTQGVWQPAGCVSCELVCVSVSLVRVVIICLASTHTALVSSPGLAVLHLSTQPNLRLNHRAAPTLAQCNRGCSLGRLISTTCTWPWWATAISAVTGMQTGEVAVAERAPLSPLPSRLFGKEKPHKATESRLARWSCRGSRLDVAHGHRRRIYLASLKQRK